MISLPVSVDVDRRRFRLASAISAADRRRELQIGSVVGADRVVCTAIIGDVDDALGRAERLLAQDDCAACDRAARRAIRSARRLLQAHARLGVDS